MADTNLYDEWASGISLANVPAEADGYFQEVQMELNKPGEFSVDPASIPQNPVEKPEAQIVQPEVPSQPQEQEINSEVLSLPNGGSITVEKTSRGWKASLDSQENGIPQENFYGSNKTQLIAELAKAKLEASKLIRKLKRDKLLGGDEPVTPATPPITARPLPASNPLTADDIYAIKNKLTEDNPSEAFDIWMQKRFGVDPDRFGEALKAAESAKEIVESQKIKSEVDDVNADFISNNPDWADEYSSDPENIRKLVARMAKAHLNKRIKLNSPQLTVDTTIYELFSRGYWTADNLERAKDELIEVGELHKLSVTPAIPKQEPQPVAEPKGPSVSEQPRIATPSGQKAVPVSFGSSAKQSVSTTPVEEKTLSDVDLQSMPLSELKAIAAAQLRAQQQGRQ